MTLRLVKMWKNVSYFVIRNIKKCDKIKMLRQFTNIFNSEVDISLVFYIHDIEWHRKEAKS